MNVSSTPDASGRRAAAPLRPLDQLFDFLGAVRPSLSLYPRPGAGYFGLLAQWFFATLSLIASLRPGARLLFIGSASPDRRLVDVLLAETQVRGRALGCCLTLRPFLLVKTSAAHPLQQACLRIGVDPASELRAYLPSTHAIIFFAEREGRPVVVHMASEEGSGTVMESRRVGLLTVGSAALPPSVRRLVPELLPSPELPGEQLLTQTRVPGKPAVLSESDEEFYALIDRALAPLREFPPCAEPCPRGPDYDRIFLDFAALPGRWPALSDLLTPLLAVLQSWQQTITRPPVLTHGDYWIRNLSFDETAGHVAGIFDWDRARPDGIPGLDAVHLVITSIVERHSGDNLDLIAQMWTRQWETEALGQCIDRVLQTFGLRDEDLGYLAAVFYLEELLKLPDSQSPRAQKRVEKMRSLQPVIDAWLAGR